MIEDTVNREKTKTDIKAVELDKENTDFASEVIRLSGVNIWLCWHCKCCSGGCHFSDAMDYHPNQIIRLVQLGMKKEALTSSTIWTCVGCNTCSVQCPQAIDMPAINDALRQIAIKENVKVAEPNTLSFHKGLITSVGWHGRAHKLEIMMLYKLASKDFFADMDVGLKMLQKRKLDILPSRIHDRAAIRKLYKLSKEKKHA